MKLKSSTKVFIIGSFTGLIVSLPLMFLPISQDHIIAKITPILLYPAIVAFRNVNRPLQWLCDLFNSDLCRGLGLDGGPLVWVEWATLIIGSAMWIGVIFVIIHVFYRKLLDLS